MTQILVMTRTGDQKTVEVGTSKTLMEAIRYSGAGELLALCGGCCSCATCHVHIGADWLSKLPPMSESEDALLDSSIHRNELSRLACQVELNEDLDGMSVTIAEED